MREAAHPKVRTKPAETEISPGRRGVAEEERSTERQIRRTRRKKRRRVRLIYEACVRDNRKGERI